MNARSTLVNNFFMTSCLFHLHIEESDWKLDQLHNYHPTGATARGKTFNLG